jgi:hypothetical protein
LSFKLFQSDDGFEEIGSFFFMSSMESISELDMATSLKPNPKLYMYVTKILESGQTLQIPFEDCVGVVVGMTIHLDGFWKA